MLPIRMESEDRYYNIHFTYDLLGDPILVCDYGGKYNKHKTRLIKLVASEDEAEQLASSIVHKRYQRGYEMISDD